MDLGFESRPRVICNYTFCHSITCYRKEESIDCGEKIVALTALVARAWIYTETGDMNMEVHSLVS